MIRVVHSNPVWLPQTQTWIHTQLISTPADRVENHIVCEKVENLDQFPVPYLHRFSAAGELERLWDRGLRRIGVRHHLGYLPRVARRLKAEIVHSHFGDVAWSNIGAARAARCRHVVTFYGYDMSHLAQQAVWRKRYRKLFQCVGMVLCEGPHMAQCVITLGCPDAKVRVHHLGIPLDGHPFMPREWTSGQKLRVLIAATFTEKKGIPYAIEALGRLQHHADLEITLIGDARMESAENQREKRRILSSIESQGLAGKVSFLGYQPRSKLVEEAYKHHIFLSPSVTAADGSTEGGAPVSIIEMAASGMLVVSTRHCDIPEVIEDRNTGLLANERDIDGLLDCLLFAVRHPELWPQMLARGRKRVEVEFNAIRQGERLAAHYEALVCGNRASAVDVALRPRNL